MMIRPLLPEQFHSLIKDQSLYDHASGAHTWTHVVFPDDVEKNLAHLIEPFSDYRIIPRVFAAHKATQSHALINRACTLGAGIDVASLAELNSALSCGFTGENIVVTGIKSDELLCEAVEAGALISLDSVNELVRLQAIAGSTSVNILIRLNDALHSEVDVALEKSRFGVSSDEVSSVLTMITQSSIKLKGFHVHHESTTPIGIIARVQNALHWIYEACQQGFSPTMLDIGGLFRFPQVMGEDVDAFILEVEETLRAHSDVHTYRSHVFGLHTNEQGMVLGREALQAKLQPTPTCTRVNQLLASTFRGRSIADHIKDLMLDVAIEPGHGLFSGAGVSIAEVIETKTSDPFELVCIDSSAFSLSQMFGEILSDLIVVRNGAILNSFKAHEGSAHVFMGNTCHEHDIISRKPTYLRDSPRAGDLVVVPNTAPYVMDFSAGNPHMMPDAQRFCFGLHNGVLQFERDHIFSRMQSHHEVA